MQNVADLYSIFFESIKHSGSLIRESQRNPLFLRFNGLRGSLEMPLLERFVKEKSVRRTETIEILLASNLTYFSDFSEFIKL